MCYSQKNLASNVLKKDADEYLRERLVGDLFCHSEFLGQKIKDVSNNDLNWESVLLEDVVGTTEYPPKIKN